MCSSVYGQRRELSHACCISLRNIQDLEEMKGVSAKFSRLIYKLTWACCRSAPVALTLLMCDCYSQKVACWIPEPACDPAAGFPLACSSRQHPIENRSEQSASCGVLKHH